MIVYHSASAIGNDQLSVITKAIPFIHSAFVGIAGFLCGYHYWPQGTAGSTRAFKRLLTRSTRIFGLFLSCNLLILLLGLGPSIGKIRAILSDPNIFFLKCIYQIDACSFAFEVLGYIAEFLCLAALVVRCHKIAHGLLFSVIILACLSESTTLLFLAVGAFGMELGIYARSETMKTIDRHARQMPCLLLFALLIDIIGRQIVGDRLCNALEFILRITETALWIYGAIAFLRPVHSCESVMQLLGRYSLFGYLFQMALVITCTRIGHYFEVPLSLMYSLNCICVTFGTCASVALLDKLRGNRAVNIAYNFVFS